MSSLLNDLRSAQKIEIRDKGLEDYVRVIQECPPVSNIMLEHLDKMFSRKSIKPTSPTMEQELVYQAGIDKVLAYLRSANERQEKEQQEIRTRGTIEVPVS